MNRMIATLFFAGFMALGASGCREAIQEVQQVYDCSVICSTYGECVEEAGLEHDLTQCINHCQNAISENAELEAQATTCQECLDDAEDSCPNGAFECADECAELIVRVSI